MDRSDLPSGGSGGTRRDGGEGSAEEDEKSYQARNFVLGLPHLTVGGLSEGWLLRECGDLHWSLVGDRLGRPAPELTDSSGHRLLSAFRRAQVIAPASLAVFSEGQTVRLSGRVTRLDGHTFVSDLSLVPLEAVADASGSAGTGELQVRLMSVFVRKGHGNQLIPALPDPDPGPASDPENERLFRAREFANLDDPDPDRSDPLQVSVYRPSPFSDLNAAGLLYFAVYSQISDLGERSFARAQNLGEVPEAEDWAARACVLSRDIVYLGNTVADQEILAEVRIWQEQDDGRTLSSRSHLLRSDDGRLLARVSTLRRVRPVVAAASSVPVPAAEVDGDRLLRLAAAVLRTPAAELGPEDSLRQRGLDSFGTAELGLRIEAEFGIEVEASALHQADTVHRIQSLMSAGRLEVGGAVRPSPPRTGLRPPATPGKAEKSGGAPIAVVGLAGRFPGADSVEALRRLLADDETSVVTSIPEDRWSTAAYPGAVPWAALLSDVRRFDHEFFRMSPREADLIDPQQRLLLETAWTAVEDAGYDPASLRGTNTGVFVGVCHQDYAAVLAESGVQDEPQRSIAASLSIVANRVSHTLGLNGPSIAVDTLCSSSLVALVQAVTAIRSGQCEQALVGGVNVICHPGTQRAYSRTGVLSPSGRCRSFDEAADGYVRGEGVAALLLKPLDQAQADGDHIHAVIRGVATNHAGPSPSLTAPTAEAQADLLVSAFTDAGVDPATVTYLEAHGTGTRLGDPIEVSGIREGLRRLHARYGRSAPVGPPCTIGSVKARIGHLEPVAGLAGLIAVVLALRDEVLPATAGLEQVNRLVHLDSAQLRILLASRPWERTADAPRRAGVSSFGLGGSNAHAVLEEPPAKPAGPPVDGPLAVPLSARSPEALNDLASALAEVLAGPRPPALADVAHTLRIRRPDWDHRRVVMAASAAELRQRLHRPVEDGTPQPEEVVAWLAGRPVEWPPVPGGRRISLPTHAFRASPHWITPSATAATSVGAAARPAPAPAVPSARPTLLETIWRAEEQRGESVPDSPRSGPVLVLVGPGQRALGAEIAGELGVCLGPADPWPSGRPAPSAVVDLMDWPVPASDLPQRLSRLREFLRENRSGAPVALHVSGPERSAVAGVYRSLCGEFGSVVARTVRVDGSAADLTTAVRFELRCRDRHSEVRYQDGRRTVPELVAAPAAPGPLPAGPALITGGTGGIGLHLARHLARSGSERLILVGRGAVPGRGQWERLADDPDPRVAERFTALLELLATGVSLSVRRHALDNGPSLRRLIAGSVGEGGLDTVYHCAGVFGTPRSFLTLPDVDLAGILLPKVSGLRALWSALVPRRPRRLVLFSSVAAVVPRLAAGHLAYAAANAALDDFAETYDGREGIAVRSVRWPVWDGLGMADRVTESGARLGLPPLPPDMALELLSGALRLDRPVLLAARADPAAVAEAIRRPVSAVPSGKDRPESVSSELGLVGTAVARALGLDPADFGPDAVLSDLGLDSLLMAELVRHLEQATGRPIDPTLVQEATTVASLASALGVEAKTGENPDVAPPAPVPGPSGSAGPEPIAIIGMGGRFPGSADPEALWAHLRASRDLVGEVPGDRWDVDAIYDRAGGRGRSVSKWGGFLSDAAEFDPEYFGIDPRAARFMDPLARKTLEVTAEAVADAGYHPEELHGRRVGVFLGTRAATYREHLRPLPREAVAGLNQNFMAAHVSQYLDLTGPNLVVDSACSSSLVALHLAVTSLATGESEMALAGGADLLLDEEQYVMLSAAGALSPQGRCRTFDEAADGLVPGEGAAVVLLRRLADARRDGDRVLAVIEATGTNNDGRTMGITTPSARSQRELVGEVLERGRIDPRTIGYVEAHGTGTLIGDPIEVQALTAVYRHYTGDRQFCGIGSVKSNIGHLLSAAGAAGLVKVVQTLRHGLLVPTLHCHRPNPRFAFPDSPFYPVRHVRPLITGDGPGRAAVSAFGFGGTNAHAVLRQAEPAPVRRAPLPPPDYHRRRFWFRDAGAAVPGARTARLDLRVVV